MTSTAAPPPSPADSATPTTTPPSNHRRRLRSPALFPDDDDARSSIKSSFLPSPLRVSSAAAAPLHELLLLSSPPPRRKGRSSRGTAGPSPRNSRRSRRRLDKDDTLLAFEEEAAVAATNPKPRKKRESRPKKEKLTLIVPAPPPTPSPETICYEVGVGFDGVWEHIQELILWKNAAKSAFWFGFGSLAFLSSWFSKDLNFSVVSAVSHLGILILAMSFFYDSFPNRNQQNLRKEFHLTEDDIVRVARIILPMANTALAVAREIFSGEPRMTLKVAPVLLFAAKYGHSITVWRLLATGFFLSFTIPRLYCSYSNQLHARVECLLGIVSETWRSCPRKRIIAVSAATLCWNSFSIKARIFAVFLSLVILRYNHQQRIVDAGCENEKDGDDRQAIVIAEQ